jgi:hypothetical protein
MKAFLVVLLFGSMAMAAPLAWEKGHSERQVWSNMLRENIKTDGLIKGDLSWFCPKYLKMDDTAKIEAWASLAVGIALYESNYNPNTVYHEPPSLGVDSIGLFQLSYEDKMSWCDMTKAENTLKSPVENIKCAVGEMKHLLDKDGVVAEGCSGSPRGLARYWSTMRTDKCGAIHKKDSIKKQVLLSMPSCK